MQPIFSVIIDIVKIQACGALVHFHRLILIANLCRKNTVHTGGETAFMNCHRLVEIKIALLGLFIIEMTKEIQTLQHICLLNKAGAQNVIPGPLLVQRPLFG